MTQATALQQLQQKSVVELQSDISELRHALRMVHMTLTRERVLVEQVLMGEKSALLLSSVHQNLATALRTIEGAL